ncbi:MAG: hypothetical protein KAG99_09465 [Bacteroidales bacterium]|nr:hypothetical protein [Bacteroidales bacterium]
MIFFEYGKNFKVAQILTYLKLSGCKLGLLANLNIKHLKDGIKHVILYFLG